MKDLVPESEIEGYKTQLVVAEKYSQRLLIKTDEDYASALIEAKAIKEKIDIIAERKEEITKPLNAAIKSARDLFRPLEDALDGAYSIVKAKMLSFTEAKEAKRLAANAKIDARIEKGTLTETEGEIKKFMNVVPHTVSIASGRATTKKVKTYHVVDKSQIPFEFLEPDMVKIKASFRSGFPVPGVEERIKNELSIT